MLAILWIPFALYLVLPSNAAPNVKTTTILSSGPAGGVYQLTLMEIMDTRWNSTLAQPRIFVMGTDGMVPAETISPPTHTTVQLTVVSYDSPTPGSTAQMGKVNGTVGGDVFLINGTSAMGNDPT